MMRWTITWRTTSWSVSSQMPMPSTSLSTRTACLRPLILSAGRSICVTSPVMTIFELKPMRVKNIFICSQDVFCASSKMIKLSSSVRPRI